MKTIKLLLLSIVLLIGVSYSSFAQHKIGGPHGCGINFSVNAYSDSNQSFYVKVWEECKDFCPIKGAIMEVVNSTTGEDKGVMETGDNGVASCYISFIESMTCRFEVTISYKGYIYGKGIVAYKNGAAHIDMVYL